MLIFLQILNIQLNLMHLVLLWYLNEGLYFLLPHLQFICINPFYIQDSL